MHYSDGGGNGDALSVRRRASHPWRTLKTSATRSRRNEMRRTHVGLFWHGLRGRLGAESEGEFPAPAFCQVESFPDGIFKIRLRDGDLQAHRFNGHPILRDVLGFVGSFFCIHGVCFYWLAFGCTIGGILRDQFVSSMG